MLDAMFDALTSSDRENGMTRTKCESICGYLGIPIVSLDEFYDRFKNDSIKDLAGSKNGYNL